MTLKNSKIIAAALSLGLVLTACGNDNANETAETPAETAEETVEQPVETVEEEVEEETAEEEAPAEEATEEEAPAEEETEEASSDYEDFDIAVVSREEGSGTRGAFVEIVGLEQEDDQGEKFDATTLDAIVQNSTNAVMQTVSGDETAIGYISLGSLNDTVKAVKVDGVEATEENIEDGSYTIARPFNLAYKEGELSELAQDFLDFTLSTEGQEIAAEEGFVPLKDTESYEGSDNEGTITVAGSTSVTPLMEKMAEKYHELNPGATIEIQSTGSSAGIESTIEGISEIGMASRALKDEESAELESVVIATDGIAVVVNNENPIEDLTLDQIKEIFLGNIINTADLK